jgi:hypothetical protein
MSVPDFFNTWVYIVFGLNCIWECKVCYLFTWKFIYRAVTHPLDLITYFIEFLLGSLPFTKGPIFLFICTEVPS